MDFRFWIFIHRSLIIVSYFIILFDTGRWVRLFRFLILDLDMIDFFDEMGRTDSFIGDLEEEAFSTLAEVFSHLIFIAGDKWEIVLSQFTVEDGHCLCQIDILFLLFDISLELRLRSRSMEVVDPVFRRSVSIFVCIDRHDITSREDVADRFDNTIDQCIIKFQPHIGMDTECEVEHSAFFGHLDDMSFGRIDEDIVVQQFYRHRIREVFVMFMMVRFLSGIVGCDAIMDFL